MTFHKPGTHNWSKEENWKLELELRGDVKTILFPAMAQFLKGPKIYRAMASAPLLPIFVTNNIGSQWKPSLAQFNLILLGFSIGVCFRSHQFEHYNGCQLDFLTIRLDICPGIKMGFLWFGYFFSVSSIRRYQFKIRFMSFLLIAKYHPKWWYHSLGNGPVRNNKLWIGNLGWI